MEEIKVGEYVSRKEYLKKYDSNVGYTLYVQGNIKRNDYARLNTGEIVRVIKTKENNITKKAIYYGIYEQDWFDASAVENFSDNIIDLIEAGDIIEYIDDLENNNEYIKSFIVTKTEPQLKEFKEYLKNYCKIISVLTKEQYEQNCYRLEKENGQNN